MENGELVNEFNQAERDEDRVKIVYASLGLAVFWIQCLEQTFENMIIIGTMKANKAKLTEKYLNDFYEGLEKSKDTMGSLIRKVQKIFTISDHHCVELLEVLKTRNFIVHGYFKKNSLKWYTFVGQLEMVNELEDFIQKVKLMDSALNIYYSDYLKEFGITKEVLEHKLNEKVKDVQSREKNRES